VTTLLPGERDVLMYGLIVRPSSTAFLATIPAASITIGFEVLVQEVIAAMTTSPWLKVYSTSSNLKLPELLS